MENGYTTSKTGKRVLKEYTRKPSTRWYELVMSCEVTPHVGAAHNIPWTHPIKRHQDQIRHGIFKTRFNLETDEWELWHNPWGV